MWRYLLGGSGAVLLVVAGTFLFRSAAAPGTHLPPAPAQAADASADLPDAAPSATARTREEKRFDRYDKNRDSLIAREEYLAPRRKAFAKLDTDGDGKLSFDEWAARTTTKFVDMDADHSATLTRAEFATSAPKPRATPKCACGKPEPAKEDGDGE